MQSMKNDPVRGKRRRSRYDIKPVFLIALLLLAFMLPGCALGIMPSPSGSGTAQEPEVVAAPSPTVEPASSPPPLNTGKGAGGIAGAPEETADTEEAEGPDVPERDVPADDDYFFNTAFLGNSLVEGFKMFSGLTTCDVYASTSMTVMGAGSLLDQMSEWQYGKVYILLGINEIGYNIDYFIEQYSAMLDKLEEQQPNAMIFIMGLTPVSEFKSSTDEVFNMDQINAYNERLYQLAEERDCYYIDLCDALADESGYLPADVTSDGIHFSAGHYKVWLDYLKIHYI